MIKKILLTGDDGYDSLGIRLLINALASQYDLTIVGTKRQQSGVGGQMSLKTGFDWGQDSVDDIKAFWIDGTPADGAEFCASYFKEPFDLIISGVNWGANLGTTIFSSGTLGAVLRGLSAQIAPKAIAMSWDLPPESYLLDHSQAHLLAEYIKYPGQVLTQLIDIIIENNFWGSEIANVNLPQKFSNKIKITKLASNAREIYDYTNEPFSVTDLGINHFSYTGGRLYQPQVPNDTDVKAITDGFISISPCRANLDDLECFSRIKSKTLLLKKN